MTEQTSHLAHALADAAVVDKGMLRPHRPTTPHIAGRYTFGLVSRFPRQPLAQDDRHSSTPRNGDCAIVSWRSPSDSFADNNLCYYPPDQSRDRLDNRSPEPISGKSQSRATPTIQKCPGHRNLHNYRRSGFRIVRASSSRCCAGEFRCRYESGSTLLILPEFLQPQFLDFPDRISAPSTGRSTPQVQRESHSAPPPFEFPACRKTIQSPHC